MKTIRNILMIVVVCTMACKTKEPAVQWESIMPDHSFTDWKIDGDEKNISHENETFQINGRTTLYYSGTLKEAKFKNFEMLADIKTDSGTVAGLWFHSGDASGYLVLINNTPTGEEQRKTGSLSGIRNIYKSMATDNEWFTMRIKVVQKHVTVKVNDILVVDYVEPEAPYRTEVNKGMRISQGTFAFTNYAGNITVRSMDVMPLPDDEQPERTDATDEQNDEIIRLQQVDFPVIDFHVHLKGWNYNQAMANSRATGIFYGIASNCGIDFPVTSDEDINKYIDTTQNMSCFQAMQGEGREWTKTFSEQSRSKFDYVFTDAMTFADHKKRRTRLWIPEEVFIDISHEKYMDMIVDRIVTVLKTEPIDIYVNPTFLPEAMMPEYDKLWTDARIKKVISALVEKGIALEINARYRLPSEKIIMEAKKAGVRFAFGTNNATPDIGKLEYCIEMMKKCGITNYDMYFPK